MSESQIRQLLLRVNDQLVEGPSATGLYRVLIAAGGGSPHAVKGALKELRTNSGLVDHAAVE